MVIGTYSLLAPRAQEASGTQVALATAAGAAIQTHPVWSCASDSGIRQKLSSVDRIDYGTDIQKHSQECASADPTLSICPSEQADVTEKMSR